MTHKTKTPLKALNVCVAASLFLLLSGCGFTPLYNDSGAGAGDASVSSALASVTVAPQQNRQHQLIRDHLTRLMNSGGNGDYQMTVVLNENRLGFGIRQDASAAQEKLTMTATIQMTETGGDGSAILSKTFSRSLSYDLVQSDFAILAKREDSQKRLLKALAEDIHRSVSLYFYKQTQAKE